MENKKIKAVVIGCGDRATVYCEEAVNQLKCVEVVAAIDPNPERLRYMREKFGVKEEQCYTDMKEVLSQGRIADCVINGTMDQMHVETALPFLEQGYHMLLEKPVVNNKEDLLKIRDTAKKHNCMLPWYPWQCTGKNWQEVTEEEKVESLKTYNPHGRCVYKCGGDIVDHQNVAVTFADGSTAVHTMMLGSMRPGRSIWIQGTLGELEGWVGDGEFRLYQYNKETSGYKATTFNFQDTQGETGGHFGGDRGLVADFCDLMNGVEPSISCTSIDDSIWGHMVCYAADESQKSRERIEL